MIMINKHKSLGSKGFARTVFDSVSPVLSKNLDKDTFKDMANEIEFFSELDLSELSQADFTMVFSTIEKLTDLDKHWQDILLEAMKQDPRFEHEPI
jgi:hypothetical protein